MFLFVQTTTHTHTHTHFYQICVIALHSIVLTPFLIYVHSALLKVPHTVFFEGKLHAYQRNGYRFWHTEELTRPQNFDASKRIFSTEKCLHLQLVTILYIFMKPSVNDHWFDSGFGTEQCAISSSPMCSIYGTKSLPEPVLACRQLDSWEQILVKFDYKSFYIIFIQENAFEIVFCQNGGHFVQGAQLNEASRHIAIMKQRWCNINAGGGLKHITTHKWQHRYRVMFMSVCFRNSC